MSSGERGIPNHKVWTEGLHNLCPPLLSSYSCCFATMKTLGKVMQKKIMYDIVELSTVRLSMLVCSALGHDVVLADS